MSTSKPSGIVFEIEGTTTDKNFLHETLGPFIKNNLQDFFNETFGWPEVKDLIKQLRKLQQTGHYQGMPSIAVGNQAAVVKSVVENIRWQMKKKTNSSQLKATRTLVWFWGCINDKIATPVYSDVAKCLHKWRESHITLCVYSMGMVVAQKLLFVKTTKGNLFCLIDHFFDSSIGKKDDTNSYKTIADTIGCDASKVLFITNKASEATTATSAGLKAVVIERPGNNIDSGSFKKIKSFEDI